VNTDHEERKETMKFAVVWFYEAQSSMFQERPDFETQNTWV